MKKRTIHNPNQLSLFNFGEDNNQGTEEKEAEKKFSALESEWKEAVTLTDKRDHDKTISNGQLSGNAKHIERANGDGSTERGQLLAGSADDLYQQQVVQTDETNTARTNGTNEVATNTDSLSGKTGRQLPSADGSTDYQAADPNTRSGRNDVARDNGAGGTGLNKTKAPNFHSDTAPYDDSKSFNKKTKYADNIAAIDVLIALQQQNRPPTAEEQIQLAKFIGWGGLRSPPPSV